MTQTFSTGQTVQWDTAFGTATATVISTSAHRIALRATDGYSWDIEATQFRTLAEQTSHLRII